MMAWFRVFDAFEKALTRHIDQLLCLRADFPHRMGSGRIRMISLVNQAGVQTDNIAFLNDMILVRDSVYHLIVHRDADRCGIAVVMEKVGNTSVTADQFLSKMVNIPGRNARPDGFRQFIVHQLQQTAGLSHQFDFSCCLNRYRHIMPPTLYRSRQKHHP